MAKKLNFNTLIIEHIELDESSRGLDVNKNSEAKSSDLKLTNELDRLRYEFLEQEVEVVKKIFSPKEFVVLVEKFNKAKKKWEKNNTSEVLQTKISYCLSDITSYIRDGINLSWDFDVKDAIWAYQSLWEIHKYLTRCISTDGNLLDFNLSWAEDPDKFKEILTKRIQQLKTIQENIVFSLKGNNASEAITFISKQERKNLKSKTKDELASLKEQIINIDPIETEVKKIPSSTAPKSPQLPDWAPSEKQWIIEMFYADNNTQREISDDETLKSNLISLIEAQDVSSLKNALDEIYKTSSDLLILQKFFVFLSTTNDIRANWISDLFFDQLSQLSVQYEDQYIDRLYDNELEKLSPWQIKDLQISLLLLQVQWNRRWWPESQSTDPTNQYPDIDGKQIDVFGKFPNRNKDIAKKNLSADEALALETTRYIYALEMQKTVPWVFSLLNNLASMWEVKSAVMDFARYYRMMEKYNSYEKIKGEVKLNSPVFEYSRQEWQQFFGLIVNSYYDPSFLNEKTSISYREKSEGKSEGEIKTQVVTMQELLSYHEQVLWNHLVQLETNRINQIILELQNKNNEKIKKLANTIHDSQETLTSVYSKLNTINKEIEKQYKEIEKELKKNDTLWNEIVTIVSTVSYSTLNGTIMNYPMQFIEWSNNQKSSEENSMITDYLKLRQYRAQIEQSINGINFLIAKNQSGISKILWNDIWNYNNNPINRNSPTKNLISLKNKAIPKDDELNRKVVFLTQMELDEKPKISEMTDEEVILLAWWEDKLVSAYANLVTFYWASKTTSTSSALYQTPESNSNYNSRVITEVKKKLKKVSIPGYGEYFVHFDFQNKSLINKTVGEMELYLLNLAKKENINLQWKKYKLFLYPTKYNDNPWHTITDNQAGINNICLWWKEKGNWANESDYKIYNNNTNLVSFKESDDWIAQTLQAKQTLSLVIDNDEQIKSMKLSSNRLDQFFGGMRDMYSLYAKWTKAKWKATATLKNTIENNIKNYEKSFPGHSIEDDLFRCRIGLIKLRDVYYSQEHERWILDTTINKINWLFWSWNTQNPQNLNDLNIWTSSDFDLLFSVGKTVLSITAWVTVSLLTWWTATPFLLTASLWTATGMVVSRSIDDALAYYFNTYYPDSNYTKYSDFTQMTQGNMNPTDFFAWVSIEFWFGLVMYYLWAWFTGKVSQCLKALETRCASALGTTTLSNSKKLFYQWIKWFCSFYQENEDLLYDSVWKKFFSEMSEEFKTESASWLASAISRDNDSTDGWISLASLFSMSNMKNSLIGMLVEASISAKSSTNHKIWDIVLQSLHKKISSEGNIELYATYNPSFHDSFDETITNFK